MPNHFSLAFRSQHFTSEKAGEEVFHDLSPANQAGNAVLQENFRTAEGAAVVAGHGAAIGSSAVEDQNIAGGNRRAK